MKKQIFLLSIGLLFASFVLPDSSCCTTSSSSNCCNTSTTCCPSTCDTGCTNEWGKTYMQVTPHFQSASPELVSCFNSNLLYNLDRNDQHGAFEVVVFGGKNTKLNRAASYFLPYGHTSLTFDGSVADTVQTFSRVVSESVVQVSATTQPAVGVQVTYANDDSADTVFVDQSSYKFDGNKDTSKILPWNFGITFAALFEPLGVTASTAGTSGVDNIVGSGTITNPVFKSTICPTWSYAHVGAGFALRYQFSDDKQGFFGRISTAVQNVRSRFCLNEDVETPVGTTALSTDNYSQVNPDPAITTTLPLAWTGGIYGNATIIATTAPSAVGANPIVSLADATSSTAPVGSIYEAYLVQATGGFPQVSSGAPTTVTEAFQQDAWLYGKISNCQKITRLADIELVLGYQWFCGDCASTNWYIGIVIPTGNKPCATYIAPAVVGNGQHVGIMTGSCTEVMLSDSADYSSWYRIDMNWRYLFRNTQKRSFDLLGNSWSRYMMVWENEAAYTAAVDAANTLASITYTTPNPDIVVYHGAAQHGYKPGINAFTTDFYIKPQFQGRINQAVYFQAEHFRAELGWNIFARQKDCVQLACDWTAAPAFADASYIAGIGLNNNRTIYNDSQTTVFNAIDTLQRTDGTTMITLATNALAATSYDDFAIGQDQIDYDSVATTGAITNTPYLVLGYAFSSDYHPQLSIGGSYEFTTSNRALNQWLVWGKFELAF